MKTHIMCLLLTSVLALGGATSIWADTTSSQTDVTITVKASPSVVPAPNQIIPLNQSYTPIRGTPVQGLLPQTNDRDDPFKEGVLGLFCLLLASLILGLNLSKNKEKKEMMK
ncbi:hypothetical protein [Lactococcus lactis]|uniref:hypothetical protein n=1 Tax=Lactococcus lactis TaxID=1358 RepID=UPI001912355C|nr:hypothetical protein [Lactococcus lactis]WFR75092.1 hypothetical protein P9166_08140 [Lactococcus lactis]